MVFVLEVFLIVKCYIQGCYVIYFFYCWFRYIEQNLIISLLCINFCIIIIYKNIIFLISRILRYFIKNVYKGIYMYRCEFYIRLILFFLNCSLEIFICIIKCMKYVLLI